MYEVDRSWLGGPLPDPGDYAFVASLGHDCGAGDTHMPAVAAERDLLAEAVARDVPVLGLCYGGQVLAAVLGAEVGRAPVPELGWREIETDDPSVVPAGPWLEWHFERFTTPPGGRRARAHGRGLAGVPVRPASRVQFHPEATVEIVAGWARADADRLAELGIADAAALLTVSRELQQAAEAAAFRLFDAFVAGH